MAQMLHKTRGNTTVQGKPRVYFACHPQDWDLYFETLTEEILQYSDCAVYYYEPNLELTEENLEDLHQMQLFVVPVTSYLLFTQNRVLESELPVARQQHIPILPLMQEPELDKAYSRIFGNLQYLCKVDEDPTALPYDEKLKKYLRSVLIEEELAQKIRAAFDAYIFLSYRKKDRRYAQELMRLIHKVPFCRDMAIWYDEFLRPGEDFNDAIAAALEKSELFVLTVTPNLVNEQNYIQAIEYPLAMGANKKVLPVQMKPTDDDVLRSAYQSVPRQVDPKNEEDFTQALKTALHTVALRENDSPEHDFFIGLAYFSGIDVEVDRARAMKLITGAAEAGLTEAMQKLAQIYSTGDGVEQDEHAAIRWWEKLLEQTWKNYEMTGRIQDAYSHMDTLLRLAREWSWFGEREKAQSLYQALLPCALQVSEVTEDEQSKWYLAVAYRRTAAVYRTKKAYKDAEEYLLKSKNIWERLIEKGGTYYQCNLAIICCELGNITSCLYSDSPEESRKGRLATEAWYQKALHLYESLSKSGRSEDLHTLADFYEKLGSQYKFMGLGKVRHRSQWLRMALKIREELVKSGTTFDQKKLANTCATIADYYNDHERRQTWYVKALDIRQALVSQTDHASQLELAKAYWAVGLEEKALQLTEKLTATKVPRYMWKLADWYCILADRDWDRYFQPQESIPIRNRNGIIVPLVGEPNLVWEKKYQDHVDQMTELGIYTSEDERIHHLIYIGNRYANCFMHQEAIAYKQKALELREKMAQRDESVRWQLFQEYESFRLTCSTAKDTEREAWLLTKAMELLQQLGDPPTEELAMTAMFAYKDAGTRDGDPDKLRKAKQLEAKWGDPFAGIFG